MSVAKYQKTLKPLVSLYQQSSAELLKVPPLGALLTAKRTEVIFVPSGHLC